MSLSQVVKFCAVAISFPFFGDLLQPLLEFCSRVVAIPVEPNGSFLFLAQFEFSVRDIILTSPVAVQR